MAEVDEFLGSVLPTLHEMEKAFHNGDVGPRIARPVLLGVLLLAFLSFINVPPLAGFVAKLRLFAAAIEAASTVAGRNPPLTAISTH